MVGGPGLTVGVVGLGRIGAQHAQAVRRLPDVGALVIADADATRARELAAELDATARAVDELLDSRPDALVIATPTASHLPLLRRSVAAGIPTFCEKPVSLELAALDAAVDEIDGTGVLVQVGFQRRFD